MTEQQARDLYKKGEEAVADLVDNQGLLVSDFWSSYVKLPCGHLFCS